MKAGCPLAFFLLPASGFTQTASPFRLGVDLSQPFPRLITELFTDSAGSLYILSDTVVTKLASDATTVLAQNDVGFPVRAMAVDPDGTVFLVPTFQPGV